MPDVLSEQEVERIAALARLALGDEERRRLATELGQILAFAAQISVLDTTRVAASGGWLDQPPVERPDEVRPSLETETALANAPERADDLFLTPRVLPDQ